jgi:hypothetical protein
VRPVEDIDDRLSGADPVEADLVALIDALAVLEGAGEHRLLISHQHVDGQAVGKARGVDARLEDDATVLATGEADDQPVTLLIERDEAIDRRLVDVRAEQLPSRHSRRPR